MASIKYHTFHPPVYVCDVAWSPGIIYDEYYGMSNYNLTEEIETLTPLIQSAIGVTLTDVSSADVPSVEIKLNKFSINEACQMIRNGVRLIISLTSCSNARYIEAVTNRLHILHFAIPRPLCYPKPDPSYPGMTGKMHTLWYQPDHRKIVSAFYAINKMEYVSRVLVLNFGLSDFTEKILNRSVEAFISQANFLPVYATQNFIPGYFASTASKQTGFGLPLSRIISSLNSSDIPSANHVFLVIPEDGVLETLTEERVGILISLCVTAGHIAYNQKLYGQFDSENVSCTAEPLEINQGGLFSLQSAKSLSRFYLWDTPTFFAVEVDRNGRARFVPTAVFKDEALQLTSDGDIVAAESDISGLFPNRFRNFSGQRIRVGVILEPPYAMSDDVTLTGLVHNATGMVVDIMENLKERFKFEYQLFVPPDGQYGLLGENGKFSGLLGELMAKHIDMIGSLITEYDERNGIGTYMGHASDETLAILQALPSFADEQVGLIKLLKADLVWPLIASVIGSSALFWLFDRISPYSASNTGTEERVGFIAACWGMCISSFPSEPSGRTLMIGYWFLAFIVYSVLQASLSATFTKRVISLPVTAIEDLTKDRSIIPLLINGTATVDFLKTATSKPVYREIYDRVVAQNFFTPNISAGVDALLKNPSYVLVGDYETLNYIRLVYCDRLAIINTNDKVGPKSQLTFLDTSYGISFDKYLLKMAESGILDRLKTQWWTPQKVCTKADTHFQTLTVYSVTELLISLAVTTGASIIVLVAEILWKHIKDMRGKRAEKAKSSEEGMPPNQIFVVEGQLEQPAVQP
ncbi:unnamed protein product [Calicophoron daubneyi]|uniref:Uncharacterized protein n=1 Tax=Calicophoron daubneyi TaxID=300641 RepID=A0AAV2TIP6_CALDB